MLHGVLILVLAVLAFLVGQNEHVRYRHAYAECHKQQVADRDLLRRDVCYNFDDRLLFKDAVDCEGAEKRLRLSLVLCAIHLWGSGSSLTHMYHTLTGSYLALFFTIMTPLLFGMYLLKAKSTELAVLDKMEKLMGKAKPAKVKQKRIDANDRAVCYKY